MANVPDTASKILSLSALVPNDYDKVHLDYTGSNPTTITYYRNNYVVCTLTLTYSGSNVTDIVRS